MAFPTEPARCVVCGAQGGTVEAAGVDYVYGGSDQVTQFRRCSGCGHVYLDPRPTPAAIPILYPSHYASFSGKFTQASRLVAMLKEAIMLSRLGRMLASLPDGARFLDVGCGDGQLLEAVKRRHPNLEVHGLDWKFDPALRARLEAQGIVLHETTLEQASLPSRSFAVVTMNQLVEHLWEPRQGLAMVRDWLADDGRLVLATPDVEGYDRRFFHDGLWGGYYFPRHLNLFSRASLRQLVAQCGLEPVEARSLVAPVVWCYSLKAWAKVRHPARPWLHRAFDVHNIPLMALATVADLVAIALRVPTSNQALVARRAGSGR